MHNITKLHCTQFAPYKVSPKLKCVPVTQTGRYKNTVPFYSLEALPLLKQFQHIDHIYSKPLQIHSVNPDV